MTAGETDGDRYPPIGDYAVVGDCHGAALISREGRVDWCCLGRFDASPIFCRLLDAERGGFLSLRPAVAFETERRYLPDTNVLETTFRTESGTVRLLDFMPVGRQSGSGVHDYVTLAAPFWLVRIVEGVDGSVPMRAEYRPTPEFARERPVLRARDPGSGATDEICRGIDFEDGPCLHGELGWRVEGERATATFEVGPGDRRHLVVSVAPVPHDDIGDRLARSLEITRAFWSEWSGYCRYDGPHRDAVVRSALTLKLLTYAPTGAIVAAATTSLPEEIGGERNWDYRFCWLRDAAFTLYALAALGYGGEADDFSEFLLRSCAERPDIQVLYGISGQTDLEERTLDHLEGYRGSRPVRIGNAAARQRQLDVYGEILDWAHLYHELGHEFEPRARDFLRRLGERVAEVWREPGQGIWEIRSEPRHGVHGKMLAWVAFDRCLDLLEEHEDGETRNDLEALREEVREHVLERGVDPDGGHLRQAYGVDAVDASLLLAPMLGFPVERQTFRRTVEAVRRELSVDGFVRRYRTDDGVAGGEGAFLICSFWLVDALLALDRCEEARNLFERLLEASNDLGLYSEEIDPATGELLGNYPQAFTHLALIQTAVNLQLVEEHGADVMWGSHASRARRGVEATEGWRAVWATFRKTGRVGRIFSSQDSIMPDEWMADSAPEDWRRAARGGSGLPRLLVSPFGPSASTRERKRGTEDEESERV